LTKFFFDDVTHHAQSEQKPKISFVLINSYCILTKALEKNCMSLKCLFYPKYSRKYGLNDIFDIKNKFVLEMRQFLSHLTVKNVIMLKV